MYIRMSSHKLNQFLTSFIMPEEIISFVQFSQADVQLKQTSREHS